MDDFDLGVVHVRDDAVAVGVRDQHIDPVPWLRMLFGVANAGLFEGIY